MLGLFGVTRTPRVQSLTAREIPLAVEGYLVYCICSFPRIDWFLDRLFSDDWSVWSFFILFLQVIIIISDVILAKSSPCKEKSEISWLSLTISISIDFFFLLLILGNLVPGIDLYLSNVVTRSVLWADLDFYIFLIVSVLLLLGDINYFIGCLWFLCFYYCVNLLFYWNRRSDLFSHHVRVFPLIF